MAYTDTMTLDDIGGADAISVPVACRRMTIRQDPAAATQVAYNVRAPASSNAAFQKYPAESTVFEDPNPNTVLQAGQIVGYGETVAGSGAATFVRLCE